MEDLYMEKLIALFEGSDEAFDTIILVKIMMRDLRRF